jgi:hypothetical protein
MNDYQVTGGTVINSAVIYSRILHRVAGMSPSRFAIAFRLANDRNRRGFSAVVLFWLPYQCRIAYAVASGFRYVAIAKDDEMEALC